eukprot:COSAG01_NODE_40835_length_459_cov_0.761111_1_plen_98_part_01
MATEAVPIPSAGAIAKIGACLDTLIRDEFTALNDKQALTRTQAADLSSLLDAFQRQVMTAIEKGTAVDPAGASAHLPLPFPPLSIPTPGFCPSAMCRG